MNLRIGTPNATHVLAVDPGGTIGVAETWLSEPDLETAGFQTWTSDNIRLTMEHAVNLAAMYPMSQHVLVYEDFISSGSLSADGTMTLKQAGYLQLAGEDNGLTVVRHVPQTRRKCLMEAEIFLKGQTTTAHEKDALAHLLAYLYGRKHNHASPPGA